METIKFRIVHKGKVIGAEKLFKANWQWMSYDLNPDGGAERWCVGGFPPCEELIRNQFTGVYDIDGKEIYMDDICSNEVAKWIVVFDRGCFSAKMVGRESSMHLALRAIVGLRVIGNIYENSEILKNK
jgi:hypothetical protein